MCVNLEVNLGGPPSTICTCCWASWALRGGEKLSVFSMSGEILSSLLDVRSTKEDTPTRISKVSLSGSKRTPDTLSWDAKSWHWHRSQLLLSQNKLPWEMYVYFSSLHSLKFDSTPRRLRVSISIQNCSSSTCEAQGSLRSWASNILQHNLFSSVWPGRQSTIEGNIYGGWNHRFKQRTTGWFLVDFPFNQFWDLGH